MIRLKKPKITDILFLIIIAVLIIPQTRQPIQVLLNKGLTLISPSVLNEEKQGHITTYDWNLKNDKAEIFNFSKTKGKVALVNFWATWCPPCIAEMPSLQSLYNDYHDKVEFIFVTTDAFHEIAKFLDKNNYTFKVYRSVSDYHDIFEVNNIPRTFLIDKEGKVIIDKTGAANWNSETVRETINTLIQQ